MMRPGANVLVALLILTGSVAAVSMVANRTNAQTGVNGTYRATLAIHFSMTFSGTFSSIGIETTLGTIGTFTSQITVTNGQASGTFYGVENNWEQSGPCGVGGWVGAAAITVRGTVDSNGNADLYLVDYGQYTFYSYGEIASENQSAYGTFGGCPTTATIDQGGVEGRYPIVGLMAGQGSVLSDPDIYPGQTIRNSTGSEVSLAGSAVTLTIDSVTQTSQPSASLYCRTVYPPNGSKFDCMAIVKNLQYPSGGSGSITNEGYNATWNTSSNLKAYSGGCGGYETYVSVGLVVAQTTCVGEFAALSTGPALISFRFTPYTDNPPVQASTTVDVVLVKGVPGLDLSCQPWQANQTLGASCMLTVSGREGIPTGNVSWTTDNGAGVFSNTTCVLSSGSCGVQYYQGTLTPATIAASYNGSAAYRWAQASATITPVANGTASADMKASTGLSVTINGTTGSLGTVSTADLQSQPNGTKAPPYSNGEYFDVRVAGQLSGGTAYVCYFGAEVNSTTTMEYYSGAWVRASGLNATAGDSICGSIPVSALSGTPLAIGSGSSSASSSTATTSATSSSGNPASANSGTIPEFPYQLLAASTFTLLVVISYLVVAATIRNRPKKG